MAFDILGHGQQQRICFTKDNTRGRQLRGFDIFADDLEAVPPIDIRRRSGRPSYNDVYGRVNGGGDNRRD